MKLNIMTPTQFAMIATILAGLTLHCPLGFAQETKKAETPKAETKSDESKAATPAVQAETEKLAAQKRAQLLKDAQTALGESKKALESLDKGNKDEAIAALEKVTGKLALIVARDPALKLAPVATTTRQSTTATGRAVNPQLPRSNRAPCREN